MPAQTTYTPIATQTLGSAVGLVTFSSIPQTYTDLVLIQSARVSNTSDITAIRANGVSTGYSKIYLQGTGSGNAAGAGTAEISLRGGYIPGTSNANIWSMEEYNFLNYTNTSGNKQVLCRCAFPIGATGFAVQIQVSTIATTAAITSITIQTANGGNLAAGSTFTLYGIGAA